MEFEFGQDGLFAGSEQQAYPETLTGLEGFPTPEHLETVFDGLLDTVAGNESITYAQHYLHGCMFAASDISSRTGAEGFFSEIGDGLAKVWEYIKRMFSWIFGGAFQKDAKEEVAKGKEEIKKTNKKIDEAQSPHITPGNMHSAVKEVEKRVDSLPESSSKKKSLKRKVDDILAEPTPAQQAHEFKLVLPEIFKEELLNSHKLEVIATKMATSQSELEKKKKHFESTSDGDDVWEIPGLITKFLNGLHGLPDAARSVDDYNSAKRYLRIAEGCLIALEHSYQDLSSSEKLYKEELTKIEHELSNKKPEENAQLTKRIDALKSHISHIANTCQHAVGVTGGIRASIKVIDNALVIII